MYTYWMQGCMNWTRLIHATLHPKFVQYLVVYINLQPYIHVTSGWTNYTNEPSSADQSTTSSYSQALYNCCQLSLVLRASTRVNANIWTMDETTKAMNKSNFNYLTLPFTLSSWLLTKVIFVLIIWAQSDTMLRFVFLLHLLCYLNLTAMLLTPFMNKF